MRIKMAIAFFTIFAMNSAIVVSAEEESAKYILEGVYNTQQAERGQNLFRNYCQDCHVPRSFGRLIHDTVKSSDNSKKQISAYFKLISTSMPQDAPGMLIEEEYLNIMAYILSLNGFPVNKPD